MSVSLALSSSLKEFLLGGMPPSAIFPSTYDDWIVDFGGLDSLEAAMRTDTQRVAESSSSQAEALDIMAVIQAHYDPYDDVHQIINTYMAGDLDVDEAVESLAAPIELLYTTGDEGRLFYQSESVARTQRPYWSPEEAEERWGLAHHYAEPEDIAGGEAMRRPSTEGLLWRLWDAILHTARKTPWRDNPTTAAPAGQDRLLALMSAIKSRPNPPLPALMTPAMHQDWVWSPGPHLWSSLVVFGPSAREEWNLDPSNPRFAFTDPEVHGWANVNAFVARMSVQGVRDIFLYGLWALREVLEEGWQLGRRVDARLLDVGMLAVEAWVEIAGRAMWERSSSNAGKDEIIDPDTSGRDLPWTIPNDDEYSIRRWRFWKAKFAILAERKALAERSREIARACIRIMDSCDGAMYEKPSA